MTLAIGEHEPLRASPPQGAPTDARRPSLRSLLRGVAHAVFADYKLNRTYSCSLPAPAGATAADVAIRPLFDLDDLRRDCDPAMRRAAGYAGPGAWGYGAWVDGSLAGVCWVWSHTRMRNGIFQLAPDERAIVELYTRPTFRGRGLGPALIAFVAAEAARAGCTRLQTWIWWSNSASIRAFEKAGWRYRSFVVSLSVFGRTLSGSWPRKAPKIGSSGIRTLSSPVRPSTTERRPTP